MVMHDVGIVLCFSSNMAISVIDAEVGVHIQDHGFSCFSTQHFHHWRVISVQRPANQYGYLKAIHTSKFTHYYRIKLGLLKGYCF